MPKVKFQALTVNPSPRKRRKHRKVRKTDKPERKKNPRKAAARKRARPTNRKARKSNPRRRSPVDRLKAHTIQATAANGAVYYWTGDRYDTNQRKAAKYFTPQAAMREARDINSRTPKELRGSLRVVRP
jgi:hypothetical protein